MENNLTVIGKGAWGGALAGVFGANTSIAGKGSSENINSKYCVLAVEAQAMREVISRHKFDPKTILIIATKGIEQTTLKLMGQVVEDVLPNQYSILSGPNFADEIDLLVDGKKSFGNVSTVVKIDGNNLQILREGIISPDSIKSTLET